MESDPERRRRGLETMAAVYGWDSVGDGEGDFFGYTVEHLFADIWNRPGLSNRDRRLLLLGALVGNGDHDVVPIQLAAALANDELDGDGLREVAIFLTHYAGWPAGARTFTQVEAALGDQAKAAARQASAESTDADSGEG